MQERILGGNLKVSAVGLGCMVFFPCLWGTDRTKGSHLQAAAGGGDGIYIF